MSQQNEKRCIVNLVTNEHYEKGLIRLINAMDRTNSDIPVIWSNSEELVNAPSHYDNPYAFKIYAIEKARSLGYDQILWLDASVYPVKNIEPVFDWLTEKGIFMEEAGHWVGKWTPQRVLDYFGIDRVQADAMSMFSAGFIGLDFRRKESIDFFAAWKEAMLNGMFKGTWEETRHDMTCGSIIANLQGLVPLYSSGGNFFAYVGPGYSTPKESAVFHLQGIA